MGSTQKPFRILSIDGGGLRGMIPIWALQHIESITGKRITELFDMITGTSTGGIIACALTVPEKPRSATPKLTLQEICSIYTEHASSIFPQNRFANIRSLFRPKYTSEGLVKKVTEYTQNNHLSDSILPLVVCSYNIKTNSPVFFKTRTAYENPKDHNPLLKDVCLATSAAPTYFPSHEFEYESQVNCIDGGVYINNPSLNAVVEILKHKETKFYNRPNITKDDVYVLSLGTGQFTQDLTEGKKLKGKIQWARPIIDVMMTGVSQTTDYQLKEFLLPQNYFRLQVKITEQAFKDLDNTSENARNHWRECYNKQFLTNQPLLNQLADFLKNSGIVF